MGGRHPSAGGRTDDGVTATVDGVERLRHLLAPAWVAPALVLAFSQWEVWVGGPTHLLGPPWATAASLGLASVLLLGRRHRPVATQVGAAAATCAPWLVWGASQVGASFLVGVTATYATGRWGAGRRAWLGVLVGVAWVLLQLGLDPLQAGLDTGWPWALYAALAWAAGAWVRQDAELERRRRSAHASRTRAELAEQRLGIARDLHDVLANSLGVMVVHAEAAEEVLPHDPQRAAAAMRRVQGTGRDALDEVRRLLEPLRADPPGPDDTSPHGAEPGSPATPVAPDRPVDLDALVARMRGAGLPLTVRRREARELPDDLREVVFRVLQEALTNTVRHAGLVETSVVLDVDDRQATLEVTDHGHRAGPPPARATGVPAWMSASSGSAAASSRGPPRRAGSSSAR